MQECLNCEKPFPHNEIVGCDPAFCTLECEQAFNKTLETGAALSAERGLTATSEIDQNNKQLINKLSEHFEGLRLKSS